jgi:hypothetical protein
MSKPMKMDYHFTGAWGVAVPEKTLRLALHLKSNTKHVVVVGRVETYDRDLSAGGEERRRTRSYSMKERLKLVNGVLDLNTQLRPGTTVHACVPLHA